MPVDVARALPFVEHHWQLAIADAEIIVDGDRATIRLPAPAVAVHVSRMLPSADRVRGLQTARLRLADAGVPVVDLLPSMSGALVEAWEGRWIEVEPWVAHDGRMNTWPRLRVGASMLASIHNAWADLDLGAAAEACGWANWVSTADASAGVSVARQMLREWGLNDLAAQVDELALRSRTDVTLPRQLVHGDFWDNNVYFRGEEIVAVTDFDFAGRRPRIDDLALMLYFADEQPFFDHVEPRSTTDRMTDLAPLVHRYDAGLDRALSDAELNALPYALARQPLWTYAGKMITHPDPDRARSDAVDTAAAVTRALMIMDDPDAWSHAFAR